MNQDDIPDEDTFERMMQSLGASPLPAGHPLDKPFDTDDEATALITYIIREIFLDSGLSEAVLHEHLRKSYKRLAHIIRLKASEPAKYRSLVNLMSTNWNDWKDGQ